MKLWYYFTYGKNCECITTNILIYSNAMKSLKVIKPPDLKDWITCEYGYYRGGKKSLAR